MTNKEVLIQALQAFENKYEQQVLCDYISCPYVRMSDCLNEQNGVDDPDCFAYKENCAECKGNWLLKEWEE